MLGPAGVMDEIHEVAPTAEIETMMPRRLAPYLRILVAFLAASSLGAAPALAQMAIGPFPYQRMVKGVPVTIEATAQVNVAPQGGVSLITAKVHGDLSDLQRKIGAIVDHFELPNDKCARKGIDRVNPVVRLTSKSLNAEADRAMLTIGGEVELWTCMRGPKKSEVEWKVRRIGPVKVRVPVVHGWSGRIQNEDASQPFEATLPAQLTKRDEKTIRLVLGQPQIRIGGRYASVTRGVLRIAHVNVNRLAKAALRQAIDPKKLQAALPPELQKLDMRIESARFANDRGHLIVEMTLTAKLAPGAVATLLQAIRSH